MKPTLQWPIFAALCVFFLGVNAIWLRQDHSPPGWDDAFYLSHSLRLYDALTTGGVPAFGRQFLTGMRDKPPLISALPTPAYLVFGRSPRSALAVNLAGLLVMFAALYGAAWKFAGPRAGWIAVGIAGTMPMMYGLSHWYLVECGLTAIVCLTICLPATLGFGLTAAAALGVLCSLGMLMKFSFPLYVSAPLLFLLWRQLRVKSLIAFLLPVIVIASPWYSLNFTTGLRMALLAGSGETAKIYGTGQIFSLRDIARYVSDVANCGPAIYFVILVVALPVCYRLMPSGARRGLLLSAIWASPLIFLTLGHYRDLRYAAPLFPAFALALGLLLDAAIERYGNIAAGVTCLILGLGIASMLHTSFGVLGSGRVELGGLLFVQPRFSYARQAEGAIWPYREVLQELYQSAKWSGGERKRVVVGNDTRNFNLDNLSLAALAERLPFDWDTTAYETDLANLRRTLSSASYFLSRDGGERESAFNRLSGEALAAVRSDSNFAEVGTRRLPDGSSLHIYRRSQLQQGILVPPEFDALVDCSVNFDGKLELSGLAMRRTGQTIEVKYRWRCLRPVPRNYWCFTHILDERGNIIGYLDHPVLKGDPPTSQWTAGSVAIERLQFTLPDAVKPDSFRLRLGLFHKESGDRLPITSSNFPLADGGTSTVTPLAK